MRKTVRRRKTNPAKVPVDSQGNLLRKKPSKHDKFIDGKTTFLGSLRLCSFDKSSSSPRRLVMVDTATEKTYPIFETDFLKMVQEVDMFRGEVSGQWGFCQKSTFYGVYLVNQIEIMD